MKKHQLTNDKVAETVAKFPSIKMVCKLQERLDDLGLNITELSALTGIRYATLIEMKQGRKNTLNLQNTLAIMVALRIKSLDELFDIAFEDQEEESKYCRESDAWKLNGIPDKELEGIEIKRRR